MNTSTLEIPIGEALEREIASIEASSHDQRISRVIAERIVLATDPKTVFISNDEVFAKSRAHLMAKLTGKTNQIDA